MATSATSPLTVARRSRRGAGPSALLPSTLAIAVLAVGAAALSGWLVGRGQWVQAAGLATLAVGLVFGLMSWRRMLFWLLLFLPFSGLLGIAAYPNTGPATLVKDILFVLPIYIGLALAFMFEDRRILFRAVPAASLLALTVLVAGQALNPELPNLTTGLIGAKVWLLYVPLLFVTYHFLRTRDDLERILKWMTLTAMVPAVVGIVEAILINAGADDAVYALYGSAAESATQDFATFDVGEGELRRVPSTFSFVAQYFGFLLAMLPVSYAWWRGFLAPRGRSLQGLIPFAVLLTAALLSGQRTAFLYVPLFVLAAMLFDDGLRVRALGAVMGLVVALYITLNVLGAKLGDLYDIVVETGFEEFTGLVVEALPFAFRETSLGLGAGANTNAARVVSGSEEFVGGVGHWVESFWAKVLLELGLFGLVIVIAFMISLGLRLLGNHARLTGWARSVSAPFLALCVLLFLGTFKGPVLDLDPMNVYFWVFVGILFALPRLARAPS